MIGSERTPRILVVDDDMLARMAAAQCVKQHGYSAGMAEGGAKALEMLRSGRYDLVLLDLLMPDVDGLEVLATMKRNPELRDIPVVVLSGADEADSIAKCFELGAVGHLSKPFDPVQLAERIDDCLH